MSYGIYGLTSALEMRKVCNVRDPISVKIQTFNTAVEECLLYDVGWLHYIENR